jgi:hypothetical protein
MVVFLGYLMILPCSIVSLSLFVTLNIKIKILNLGFKMFCNTNDNLLLLLLLLLFYVPMYCLQYFIIIYVNANFNLT